MSSLTASSSAIRLFIFFFCLAGKGQKLSRKEKDFFFKGFLLKVNNDNNKKKYYNMHLYVGQYKELNLIEPKL